MSYTDTDVAKLILNLLTKAQFDTSSKSPLELWFTTDEGFLPDTTKFGAGLSMSVDPSTYVLTLQLKDQDGNALGTAQTVDLPIESLILSVTYDSINKRLVITLQNGNVVYVPLGDLISGLQTEITSSNKLDADLVDDSTSLNKFVTAAEKSSIANAVQKSGGTMTGDLETPGVITSTLWFKDGALSTYGWASVDLPNSNVYFGNINYSNILRGSSLQYMSGNGILYSVYTTKDVINGTGSLSFEYDNDINEYVGKITLTDLIPNDGRMYKVCYYPSTSYLWPYIKSFGVFYTGPGERGCYIMFDQQLFIDYPNAHLGSYACKVLAFPVTGNSTGCAQFTLMGWDSYDSGYVSNCYTISEVNKQLATKQDISNLVTSVSSSSTDSQYPSAKLFYDTVGDIETLINAL